MPDGVSPEDDMGLAVRAAAGLILHDNIHVPARVVEEAAKPIEREVLQLPAHKRGHLGLVNTEKSGSRSLAQVPLPDDLNDLHGKFSFRQVFFGMGKTSDR